MAAGACLQHSHCVARNLAAQGIHCRRHQGHDVLQPLTHNIRMIQHEPPGLTQRLHAEVYMQFTTLFADIIMTKHMEHLCKRPTLL